MLLHTLRPRLGVGEDVVWVTVRTRRASRCSPASRCTGWHPARPDAAAVARNALAARKLFRLHDVHLVVSTGAALALAVLPQARMRGIDRSLHRDPPRGATARRCRAGRWLRCRASRRSASPATSPVAVPRLAVGPLRRHPDGPATSTARWSSASAPRWTTASGGCSNDLCPSSRTATRAAGRPAAPALPASGSTLAERVPSEEMRTSMSDADVVVAHAGTGIG